MLMGQTRLHCAGISVEGCDRRRCWLRHRELRPGEEQQPGAGPCEEASLHAFEVALRRPPTQCMPPQSGEDCSSRCKSLKRQRFRGVLTQAKATDGVACRID